MSQRTIYEVQTDLAHSIAHGEQIVWDSLSADQSEILQEKIKNILPATESPEGYKARDNLFRNVWSQRKYTNRVLLSSLIYVLVTNEKNHALAKHSTSFSCHPVIRTRRCLSSNNSLGCCMIFIDEQSRVYKNWKQYLNNNVLPSGTMIAPANGVYTFDKMGEVELEICTIKNKCLARKCETVLGVSGLISGTAPIALSMIMPIAAPIMLTSTLMSVATGTYAIVRSAADLKDRYKHCQSTSLTNPEARRNWLNVAGGVTGLGAMGASKALTYVASSRKGVPLLAKVAVGGINMSSMVISGSDIVNTVHDLYLQSNDERFNGMDVLQLASSLLVFTHSINNLALLSNIPTRQGSAPVRGAIRKHIRIVFNKISNEFIIGKTLTKVDLIRVVNNIPSTEAFIQQIGLLLMQSTTKTVISNALNELPKIINYSSDGEFNPVHLLRIAGFKFVRNILNSNSFVDLLTAMANFMCDKSFYLLLNLTKTFMDEYDNVVNDTLRFFIPTEKVLYEMFMMCVQKYSNLSYEFLEDIQTEILDGLERYFNSLNPVNENIKAYNCKTCKGCYYKCTL